MTTIFDSAQDSAQPFPWSAAVALMIVVPSIYLVVDRRAINVVIPHDNITPSRPSSLGLISPQSESELQKVLEIFLPTCKPGM
jgi:hypothetical protein